MMRKKLKGAVFSLPMFYKKNFEIDFVSLESYIKKCLESNGVECIFSMAYNTRFRQLSDDEILEISKLCCKLSQQYGKKAIIGHPYTITNQDLRIFCQKISSYKPYAISLLYPERYYGMIKPVVDFFSIPQEYGLKVLVHEQKLVSGFNGSLIDWPIDLLQNVLSIDSVIAVKEDSKSDEIVKEVIEISKSHDFDVIVAGGGKIRARKLIDSVGLSTWLNGSLMLFPELSEKVNEAYLNKDEFLMNWYEKNIEIPYFESFISKVGWHVGHKAALHLLDYCELVERAPMPIITSENLDTYKGIILEIKSKASEFLELTKN